MVTKKRFGRWSPMRFPHFAMGRWRVTRRQSSAGLSSLSRSRRTCAVESGWVPRDQKAQQVEPIAEIPDIRRRYGILNRALTYW